MADDDLFGDLPVQGTPRVLEEGRPRLRQPIRDQIELRAVDLDGLIGPDHPARLIWAYVQGLDLGSLEQAVRAREHTPGQAPVSPRLLLALWLYATSEGIGSARALARLCESHDAYRWLCGGVSVNYHGLADFRTAGPDLLDRLLSENVATLSAANVISLDEVVQDGVRVRASAGAASFRRKKTLHKELKKAQRRVAQLKQEVNDDPDASNRRIRAANERAAREREARVKAARAARQNQQKAGCQTERAAVFDHRSAGSHYEDARRRLPSGLQLSNRHSGEWADRRRRRRDNDGLRSWPDATHAQGDRAALRPLAQTPSRRWRLQQE
jgi:transposase